MAAEVGPPRLAVGDRPQVARRKFATPPVKVACLSCRASRTRCDGNRPCASCVTKGNECVYRPSRRGGPRVRKKTSLSPGQSRVAPDIRPHDQTTLLEADIGFPPQPLPLQRYIEPGAGLKQLQDVTEDSDFMFDSLFVDTLPDPSFDEVHLPQDIDLVADPVPMARTYRSDYAILQAYYIWIHPFFPILPPPERTPLADQVVPLVQDQPTGFEDDFEPSTPLTLALSAILALIPCPEDTNHASPDSLLFRRKYAQFLAQSAIESIEIESEIPESSVEPPKALSNESPGTAPRAPFHPRVPVELESIVALDLLSVYEYCQRGNLKKMRSRSGQAFANAMMNFSLHTQTDDDDDYYSEAKRRIWWMTFICVCQGSIVSNTPPSFDIFTSGFTTKYPTLDVDPEAWPALIQSQQAILAATQFVIELNKAVNSHADMNPIYEKMQELENFIGPLVEKSELWTFTGPLAPPVDPSEQILSRSLKAIARIKLNSARIKVHRYCAFFDLPVFSGKHCDLKSTAESAANGQEPRIWPSCPCAGSVHSSTGSPESSNDSASSPSVTAHTPHSDTPYAHQHVPSNLPFSSHYSAKICLRSALSITTGFDNLPYPNPSSQFGQDICFLSPTSSIVAPRTMPSFSCCAMQGAYSLLMIYQKTKSMYPSNGGSSYLVSSMLVRLQQGLTSILAALENYGTAFEAIGGMRDQVRTAVESSMVFEA